MGPVRKCYQMRLTLRHVHIWSLGICAAVLVSVSTMAEAAAHDIEASQPSEQIADASVCNHYAAQAEVAWKIPHGLLWAIGMVESKRNNGPWPWTLDAAGRPYYFDSRAQAVAFENTAVSSKPE